MVFGKLFGRKNNDNSETLIKNQEEIELEKELYKKRENSEKYFEERYGVFLEKQEKIKFKEIISGINDFLNSFRKHKENFNKEITDEFMLKMLLNKLKEDSIKNINNLFTIFNIDKNSNKDVLEAYNKAIEEIENS